jgi:lipoprotein-anchoring transpeptidase ErfK/SrfK
MRDGCSLRVATERSCAAAAPSRHEGALTQLILAVVCAIIVVGCGSSDGQAPQLLGSQANQRQTTSAAQPGVPGAGIATAIPSLGKVIVVHTPSFELIALEDGAPVLRSRVIVGRPATPTPELLSSMFSIRFNPAWMPTPSMIRYERAHYVPPGPNNPLGQLLFELDNDQLIFLHDTNDRSLFGRSNRALSHGCVRVEQARPLAAWALGISVREVEAMISSKATYSVPLSTPIPVYLVYRGD